MLSKCAFACGIKVEIATADAMRAGATKARGICINFKIRPALQEELARAVDPMVTT